MLPNELPPKLPGLILILLLCGVAKVTQAAYYFETNAGGAVTITQYVGPVRPGGDVIIPDELGNLPVTTIGSDIFHGDWPDVTAITLGVNVTNIEEPAFGGCVALT